MTINAKIQKAEQLLAERAAALKLIDKYGADRGKIISDQVTDGTAIPALSLDSGRYTLETLERWIKQAKSAHKKGFL